MISRFWARFGRLIGRLQLRLDAVNALLRAQLAVTLEAPPTHTADPESPPPRRRVGF